MAKFIYLFRSHPDTFRGMSPEQMQQTLKRWLDWRSELEKSTQVKVVGERLDPQGKVVRGKKKTVTDGPFVEVKDFIQGYMLVEARDVNQAMEFAAGCPGLDYDATVEVRPLLSV